jgi:hypothetical protein
VALPGAGFVDAETGTTWNILGQAIAAPLAGQRLTPVTSFDTFWFAWVGFQPDTRLVAASQDERVDGLG